MSHPASPAACLGDGTPVTRELIGREVWVGSGGVSGIVADYDDAGGWTLTVVVDGERLTYGASALMVRNTYGG